MAPKKSTKTAEVEDQLDVDESEDIDESEDLEDLGEIADFDEDGDALEPAADTEGDDLDDGADEGQDAAALDELEAAELSMLTPDEAAEVIRVDEAAEVASLRQAELALDREADSVTAGEFVCSSCFLVKKDTQLANKRKQICNDCAA